jgi:small subunit ribosomal protein S23
VPKEIRYIEDEVRRRFYGDFPFEAMRPVSLVELRSVEEEHPIRGKEWTRLEQRGTYPTVEEYVGLAYMQRRVGLMIVRSRSR